MYSDSVKIRFQGVYVLQKLSEQKIWQMDTDNFIVN